MFHEYTQNDQALFNRLVPEISGKRTFSPIYLKRLNKLNINKTDPMKLTEDEIRVFVRLIIDLSTITWQRVVDTNGKIISIKFRYNDFYVKFRSFFASNYY